MINMLSTPWLSTFVMVICPVWQALYLALWKRNKDLYQALWMRNKALYLALWMRNKDLYQALWTRNKVLTVLLHPARLFIHMAWNIEFSHRINVIPLIPLATRLQKDWIAYWGMEKYQLGFKELQEDQEVCII